MSVGSSSGGERKCISSGVGEVECSTRIGSILRSSPVPFRRKLINELINELIKLLGEAGLSSRANRIGIDGVRFGCDFTEPRGCSFDNVVVVSEEFARSLWKLILEDMGELIKCLTIGALRTRLSRGLQLPKAEEVASFIADLIAYLFHWNIHPSPAPELGIVSPARAHLIHSILELAGLQATSGQASSMVDDALAYAADATLGVIMEVGTACSESRGSIAAAIHRAVNDLKVESVGMRINGEAGARYLREAYDLLLGVLKYCGECRVVELLRRLRVALELAYYLLPADTRPGLNDTPLLVHERLTSAIASATLRSKRWSEESSAKSRESAILRLAALLHDAGKPLCYAHHVKVLSSAWSTVFNPLLSELERLASSGDEWSSLLRDLGRNLRHILEDACVVARRHHDRTRGVRQDLDELLEILSEADKAASSLDRLSEVARWFIDNYVDLIAKDAGVSSSKLNELKEKMVKMYEGGDWEAYGQLVGDAEGLKLLVLLSRALARIHGSPRFNASHPALQGTRRYTPRVDFLLSVWDVGGVQKAIAESQKMRVIIGTSLFIDWLTVARLPQWIMREYEVPLECIIYAAGATIHAILPAVNDARRRAEQVAQYFDGGLAGRIFGLTLRFGVSKPYRGYSSGYYGIIVSNAYSSLGNVSTRRHGLSVVRIQGVENGRVTATDVCEWCGVAPAVVSSRGLGRVCLRCLAKYLLFEVASFRWRNLVASAMLGTSVAATGGPVELLGVSDPNSLAAVIKADGNTIGAFMSSSPTPAIYAEKSLRVDLASKRALSRVIEVARRVAEDGGAATRAVGLAIYGPLYAGGDDVLMLAPGSSSYPIAALLAYEYGANLGFASTLSVGVVAGYYEQPIWWMLESAEELLDEAKSVARDDAFAAIDYRVANLTQSDLRALCSVIQVGSKRSGEAGAVAALSLLRGLLAPQVVEEASRLRTSQAQPLLATNNTSKLSVFEALELMRRSDEDTGKHVDLSSISLEQLYENVNNDEGVVDALAELLESSLRSGPAGVLACDAVVDCLRWLARVLGPSYSGNILAIVSALGGAARSGRGCNSSVARKLLKAVNRLHHSGVGPKLLEKLFFDIYTWSCMTCGR